MYRQSVELRLLAALALSCGFAIACSFPAACEAVKPQKPVHAPAEPAVSTPATTVLVPPSNSLLVTNLRPAGDGDAQFYAVGFARALSVRLQAAPTQVTMQPSYARLQTQLK